MTKKVKKNENILEENESKGISRRNFVKLSVGSAAAVAGYSVVKNPIKTGTAYAVGTISKEHDEFPIPVSKDYKRMNQKNQVFCRVISMTEPKFMPILKKMVSWEPTNEPGWTQLEVALCKGAGAIDSHHTLEKGAFPTKFGVPKRGLLSWDGEVNENKYQFKSIEEASKHIKKGAEFLGASLVGIAPFDERWVYSHYYDPNDKTNEPIEFPFEVKSVIVMALEMDYEALKTAPSHIAGAATTTRYSDMITVSHKVATFIRELGYRAVPCGNDTAISVALGVHAGLGEASRMGLLITPEYGPRQRICKVFTDLELKTDKPISFGVREFCKVCMKCADSCPSDAISRDVEPSLLAEAEAPNISYNAGVEKWFMNSEKCYEYWSGNGIGCSCCISACPYNKLDSWHHDLAKLATVTPGMKSVAREFDELFGYGETFNKKVTAEWWNKK